MLLKSVIIILLLLILFGESVNLTQYCNVAIVGAVISNLQDTMVLRYLGLNYNNTLA